MYIFLTTYSQQWGLLRGNNYTHFVTQNLNQMFWWVKIYLSLTTFCVIKWFQRKVYFKRKNIFKKPYNLTVCTSVFHLITVLVSCTWRVFKVCRHNQSVEKSSHFTLLYFTICRKMEEKKTPLYMYTASGTI